MVQVEEWPGAGCTEGNSAVVQLCALSTVPVELVGAPAGHADLHAEWSEKVDTVSERAGCGELQTAVETLALVQLV